MWRGHRRRHQRRGGDCQEAKLDSHPRPWSIHSLSAHLSLSLLHIDWISFSAIGHMTQFAHRLFKQRLWPPAPILLNLTWESFPLTFAKHQNCCLPKVLHCQGWAGQMQPKSHPEHIMLKNPHQLPVHQHQLTWTSGSTSITEEAEALTSKPTSPDLAKPANHA